MAVLNDSSNTLLDLVRETFDAHSVVLFLPDHDGRYVLSLVSTESPPFPKDSLYIKDRGLSNWILRHHEPVKMSKVNMRNPVGYYDEEGEELIQAFMGCYLPEDGVLCVDTLREHDYSEAEVTLLDHFAQHISRQVYADSLIGNTEIIQNYLIALEQITLFAEKHLSWRNYLYSFLTLLVEVSGFDYVAFASCVEDANSYSIDGESSPLLMTEKGVVEIPLASGGMVGWVFRNETPIHTDGLDGSPTAPLFGKVSGVPLFQAVICRPLFVERTVYGVLCLAGVDPRPLSQELRSFVHIAATQFSHQLESIWYQHRLQSKQRQGHLHRDGAIAYNPDTAPSPPFNEATDESSLT